MDDGSDIECAVVGGYQGFGDWCRTPKLRERFAMLYPGFSIGVWQTLYLSREARKRIVNLEFTFKVISKGTETARLRVPVGEAPVSVQDIPASSPESISQLEVNGP